MSSIERDAEKKNSNQVVFVEGCHNYMIGRCPNAKENQDRINYFGCNKAGCEDYVATRVEIPIIH